MQVLKEIIEDSKEIIEDGKEIVEHGKEILDTRKELIEDLFERTEEYIKTNVQLYKLKAIDKLAEVTSSLVSNAIVVLLGFFFFLMINIGVALWLGEVMGQTYYGFFVVAGFYLVLSLIIFSVRKNMISTPLSNSIISQMLKTKAHEQDKSNRLPE